MAKEKEYDLNFEGYWRNKEVLPEYSGIYFVYRAVPHEDPNTKKVTVTLKELIYIGQAENILERHKSHEKQTEFEQELKPGEELCYSTTEVTKNDLNRVENGLIYKRKPRLNDKGTQSFDHPRTTFILNGVFKDFSPNRFTLVGTGDDD